MGEIAAYRNYQEYKSELDHELQRTTEAFVRIGYLLKVARDTDILRESGYGNVVDFAKAEYNIDKTQVSRFIHINDRFAERGYSDRLKEQYRGFGHAKLALMLQLPDEITEELSPDYSKAEIQAIKEEVDEEKKKTDIEIILEGQKQEQHDMDNIHKVMHQLGKDAPELYVSLHHAVLEGGLAAVKETLAPAGEKIYSVRIQGIGRFMMSVKEQEPSASLTNIRNPQEKELISWENIQEAIQGIMVYGMSPEESWSATYGEEFPGKEKVAPVQPDKNVREKETKVAKAKPEEPKIPEKPEKTECGGNLEKQIPGQMEVGDFPQYMPDPARTEPAHEGEAQDEALTGTVEDNRNLREEIPENVINTECGTDSGKPEMPPELARQRKEEYTEAYMDAIAAANRAFGRGVYEGVLINLREAEKFIEEIMSLPETGEGENEE